MDVLSAYEAIKGFTRPLEPSSLPKALDLVLLEAHQTLIGRRKMTRIRRSHSFKPSDSRLGDLVQLYHRDKKRKKGNWLPPRQVLSVDHDVGMVTVPGLSVQPITVVFEDTRAAHVTCDKTEAIKSSLDELDSSIHDLQDVEDDCSSACLSEPDGSVVSDGRFVQDEEKNLDNLFPLDRSNVCDHSDDHQDIVCNVEKTAVNVMDDQNDHLRPLPSIGDRLEVL